MTGLDFQMTELVPNFILRDKNGYACAKALEVCLRAMAEAAEAGAAQILDISQMTDARLDEMAWEWDVQWYDRDAPIEAKRRTIAGMWGVMRKAGTPAAISDAIAQYFGSGRVKEWFEYGGDAYHFKAVTGNEDATGAQNAKLTDIIGALQNARSVYDGAEILHEFEQKNRAGAFLCGTRVWEMSDNGV